jgi:hypothetical protein
VSIQSNFFVTFEEGFSDEKLEISRAIYFEKYDELGTTLKPFKTSFQRL